MSDIPARMKRRQDPDGMMRLMGDVIDLRRRRVYSFNQIDRLLNLRYGTASRWIDGYERGGRSYPPVVRHERSGDTVATWGEFVECRFLAEYRDAGVPIQRMRPAIDELRQVTNSDYPLASAQLWLAVDGRELVAQVQDDVKLEKQLSLVVVRTGQAMIDWSPRAARFREAVTWSNDGPNAEPLRITPDAEIPEVEIDPRRGFGDPVIRGRNVTTSVLSELVAAGEPVDAVAEAYSLSSSQVSAAVRYERHRAS